MFGAPSNLEPDTRPTINAPPPPQPAAYAAPPTPPLPGFEPTDTAPTGQPAEVSKDLPTYRGPEDDLTAEARRIYEKENAPLQKISRKRAALAGALYGLGQGLQSGNIGVGIGAAAAGAVGGAIAPRRLQKMKREDEIAEDYAKLGRRIKTAGTIGEIQARAAETQRRIEEPKIEREKLKSKLYDERVDRAMKNLTSLPKYDPNDKTDAASQTMLKEFQTLGIADQIPSRTAETPVGGTEWVPKKTGTDTTGKPVWELVPFEKLKAGGTREVKGLPHKPLVTSPSGPITPAESERNIATAAAQAQRIKEHELDVGRRQTERGEDISREDFQKQQAREEKAAKLAGDVDEYKSQAVEAQKVINSTTDPKTKAAYEYIRQQALNKAQGAATELSQGYGDIYEAGPGEGGWPYYKRKAGPATPPVMPGRNATPGQAPDKLWKSLWLKSHPGKESQWPKAVEEANRQGIKVMLDVP
jgi:hypothetical protein